LKSKNKRRLIRKTKLEKDAYKNEDEMKSRGEFKARKDILTKDGKFKNISSTQKGQQLILDESLRILADVSDWINNKSGKLYRAELKSYFTDDDVILQRTIECLLYMAGSIYSTDSETKTKSKNRHKKVNSIREKIMPELSFNNVWRFLEVVINYSQYFNSESSIEYKAGKFSNNIKYTCTLSEIILEEINMIAMQSFYSLPMTVPPVEWEFTDGNIKGGYETYQFEMVRSGLRQTDYSMFSQEIFDSINYIQSVPWIVNKPVLEQVIADLKAPNKADYVVSEYPVNEGCRWDLKLNVKKPKKGGEPEQLSDEVLKLPKESLEQIIKNREIYTEKAALYNAEVSDYESALGKYRYVKLATQIAEQYVGKQIYFPHSFDFRGRIYPLPIGLSPQGSDSIKALLLYANSEPIDKHGLDWSWAYLASLYGDDKLDFEKRVLRGKELINTDYKEADEPYQFLSHQMELKKYLEDNTYQPSIRIHLDACNSGSQFTSAITNDISGCKATNVIPTINPDGTQSRQDAYMLVAEKSIDLSEEMFQREQDNTKKNTIGFLQSLLKKDGRKICKVPVMVSNYGGTAGGRSDILWNMLRELGVDRKWITKKVASLFSKIIGDSIVGVLNGGKAFETYIHRMNNVIAKENNPVTWTTSDGFYVVHSKNKELKPKVVKCLIPGARRPVVITKKNYSKNLSSSKMKSAISPNYIHSLDAELLRRTALRMRDLGIVDTDWIHDSFGCHPNYIELLLKVTKEVFLELMQSEPIKLLDSQLREQAINDPKVQKELNSIVIPNLGANELPLHMVMESDWFFS